MNLDNYLNKIASISPELSQSVSLTSEEVYQKINNSFDFRSHSSGLLLGNVQSGKTVQLMGCITKLADEGFKIFIVLTSDNVYLQQQTIGRIKESISDFSICNEYDDIEFLRWRGDNHILIVLKKNTNVLKRWKNLLASSGILSGRPLIIIDDEADSASLNTLVNKKKISAINGHLQEIWNMSSSSIYLEVTATPQALILQSSISNWKPDFVHYFNPGGNYIGGDLIFSDPISYTIKLTPENELDEIKSNTDIIPIGLRDALLCYLIICADFVYRKKDTCNFLVHPSVKIDDHEKFADVLGETLNSFLGYLEEEESKNEINDLIYLQWSELQRTQPDIINYDDCCNIIGDLLTNSGLSIIVLNSKTNIDINYDQGFNIIVGGNSLGRGVTFPSLQVVYYCRKSKTPQADTSWQHSRIFGYDRIPGLIRVFLPPSLHQFFSSLNDSNRLLINQIMNKGLEGIQLIYPKGVSPTRKNVLDKKALNILVGGVNFFPRNPSQNNVERVDELLTNYDSSNPIMVSGNILIEIIIALNESDLDDWNYLKFLNCIKALIVKRPTQIFSLIIRRDRDISKGTGTLLSPNDRALGESFPEVTILTLYRNKGYSEKGWNNIPFWIPNIKFPTDVCFFDTLEL